MKKEYQKPTIEITKFNEDILLNLASVVVNYPWIEDNDNNNQFFE